MSRGFTAILPGLVEQFAGRCAAGGDGRRRLPRNLQDNRPGRGRGGAGCAVGHLRAIYLVEYGRGLRPRDNLMVDILAGVPSIVAALFIFALWIATLGFPQSAFAVSLALVLLMLPVVVEHRRDAEARSRRAPRGVVRIGIPKWKTIARDRRSHRAARHHQRDPAGAGRVIGETAPVLVLVGYASSINMDVFEGNMASLPLLIYTELINPEEAGPIRVSGAALTFIVLVAPMYVGAAYVGRCLTRDRV